MRVDLRGRECWGRKTENKVVGNSESRSLGGGTVRRGRLIKRWLDRVRADLWGRDCWGRKTEKKVVGQSESRSPGMDCWRRKTEKKVVGQSESISPGEGLLGEED